MSKMKKTTDIYCPTGEVEKAFINCIWRLSESGYSDRKEIILPKGTVEIIFNFSDTITYVNPSFQISTRLPAVFVNGINSKPFQLIKTGRQEFLGIQLKSMGLKLLFNTSAKEFNNRVYAAKDVCPSLDILADELLHRQSFSRQVESIMKWIHRKISTSKNHATQRAHRLHGLVQTHNLTVKRLSQEICLSDRQLRRFSQDWLGMNTEEVILYNKYLRSLHLLHHSKQSLTEIGLEAGYYDQSHFLREFKSYTDLTPKQYREANAEFLGHIFV